MRRLRWADDRGSPSVELVGVLPLLIVAALAAWQLALVAFVATQAENAARAASRAQVVDGNGYEAGIDALPAYLRDGATAEIVGTKSTVRVAIPLVMPGMRSDSFAVTRTAELPDTS
jgi:hypothetical protein